MNRNKSVCSRLQNLKNRTSRILIGSLLCVSLLISSFSFVFADDDFSTLNAAYYSTSNYTTYNSSTYAFSYYRYYASINFKLPVNSSGYTIECKQNAFTVEYIANEGDTMFSSYALSAGDTFHFDVYSSSSINFKIDRDPSQTNTIPDTGYLNDFVGFYVGSIPVPDSGYTNLENGNIVYFDLGSGKTLDIEVESYFYSKSGVISGIWADDNRRYGFTDSLPTANTTIGETSGNVLSFSKSTKGQNLLGQTNYGIANISGTSSGRYLWIVNPMYNNKYFEDSLSADALNGLMTITGVPAGTTVYTYKLKQNASSLGLDSDIPSVSGGVGSVATDSAIQTQYVSTDDPTQTYTQTVGGDNSAPEEVSAAEGIRQTLDQFVNGFMNLFTAPISHIQQLISSGSSFIQTLGGLFSWLPTPVTNVLSSALVLFIVIGVLKLLL